METRNIYRGRGGQLTKAGTKRRGRHKDPPTKDHAKHQLPLKVGIFEGRRLVELRYLADQLQCGLCNRFLFLQDVVSEERRGLASIIRIKCSDPCCPFVTQCYTGKRQKSGKRSFVFDVNKKAILGK